ncbi:MAG TPA: helix-turn-helix domain-containing protein, partial [Candidatus Paceibacterota bacterium]|nr:helix-turn-helix domain-containing protein [Candidatus Paceibacterota bacterium]
MSSLLPDNLISTKEASEFSGYHSDYLARMCRAGKIEGRQVGRTWLVSRESVEKFKQEQEERKRELAASLSKAREAEYQKVKNQDVKPVEVPAAPIAEAAPAPVIEVIPASIPAPVHPTMAPARVERPQAPVKSPYAPSAFAHQALALSITIAALSIGTQLASTGLWNEGARLAIASVESAHVLGKSAYLAALERTGAGLFAFGTATRDLAINTDAVTAFRAPGEFVVASVDAILDGYAFGTFRFAEKAPELPKYAVESTRALGTAISSMLATGIVTTPDVYEHATNEAALATVEAAEGVIAFTDTATRAASIALAPADDVLEGAGGTATQSASAVATFSPDAAAGVRDWFLGRAEHLARSTYGTFSIFYDWAGYAVASIMDPYTNRFPIVMVDYPRAGGTTATSIVNRIGTTTIIQNYHQTAGEGASVAYVDMWVARLQRAIDTNFENINDNGTSGGGITEVSGDIDVTSITVTGNGTFGGNVTITGTLSAGSLAVGSLSTGLPIEAPYFSATSTSATSTFLGGFYAKRVEAGDYLAGPYILATSTTATSVFSGNIAANGNTTIGDASSDTLTVNASIASSLIPSAAATYDLGSITSPWRTLFAESASTTYATSTSFATTNFRLGGSLFTSLLGNGLTNSGGILAVSTTSLASGFFLNGGNSFGATGVIGTNDAQALQLETNNLPRITIDSSGNVGVGTSTPGSLFSIANIANFTAATTSFYSTGGINLAGGCFAVNGTCLGSGSGSGTVNSGTAGQIAYYDANGTAVSGTSSIFVAPSGNVGIGTTSPYARLSVVGQAVAEYFTATSTTATSTFPLADITNALRFAGDYFTDLTGTGLQNVGGALSINATGDWTGTFDGQEGSYYLANSFSTSSAQFFVNGSTTIPKTYTANTFTGSQVFSGGVTIGTLNGPLQANAGVVSATTSIGVLYGGTGLTTAPSYGNILVGNSSGGYTLTATSSLGLATAFTTTYPIQNTNNVLSLAFGTTSNNTWSGTNNFIGNVGIGSSSPFARLSVHANADETATTLFAIGSSTASATTTLFSVSNQGLTTLQVANSGGEANLLSLYNSSNGSTNSGSNLSFRTTNSNGAAVNTARIASILTTATAGSEDSTLVFRTIVDGGLTERVRIHSDGNIGIGTTSPYAKLSVVGQTVSEYFTATSTTATSTFPNLALTNLLFGSDYVTDLTGSGLSISNGALTIGTVGQANGGTGFTTYTAGDILYADGSGNLAKLPIGGNGTVLKVAAGLPSWGTDLTSGGGGGAGAWATTTDSLAVYPTDTTDVIIIGTNATTTSTSIFEVSGRSYFSSTVSVASTSPWGLLSVNPNGITGPAFVVGSSTGTNFIVTDGGRVGIGTTAPAALLGVA